MRNAISAPAPIVALSTIPTAPPPSSAAYSLKLASVSRFPPTIRLTIHAPVTAATVFAAQKHSASPTAVPFNPSGPSNR